MRTIDRRTAHGWDVERKLPDGERYCWVGGSKQVPSGGERYIKNCLIMREQRSLQLFLTGLGEKGEPGSFGGWKRTIRSNRAETTNFSTMVGYSNPTFIALTG